MQQDDDPAVSILPFNAPIIEAPIPTRRFAAQSRQGVRAS
jgi:hypothetical protein